MKPLLLTAFCFCSVCVFSQHNKNNPLRVPSENLKKFKGTNGNSLQKQFQEYFKRKNSTNLLSNIQGNIAILPQDHMPCVVPNTGNIATMPNAWNGVAVPYIPQYQPMPNPALPRVQSYKWNTLDNSLNGQTK